MADRVPDEFLKHWAKRFREGPDVEANEHASVYEELLQRRQDGMSPEEFIVSTAARLGELPPDRHSMVLHALAQMRDGLTTIRRALTWAEGHACPSGAAERELVAKTAEVLQRRVDAWAEGQDRAEHD